MYHLRLKVETVEHQGVCDTPMEVSTASKCSMCYSKASFLSIWARSNVSIVAILPSCLEQPPDVHWDGLPYERAWYEKYVPRTGVTFGPTCRTLPAYSGLPNACSYVLFGAQHTMSSNTLWVAAGSLDNLCVILSCMLSIYNTHVVNKYFITRIT